MITGLCAAQVPDAPKPQEMAAAPVANLVQLENSRPRIVDRKFMAMEGIMAASLALDAYSTAAMNKHCHETNPILGQHPSNGATAAFMAAQLAGASALQYATKRMLGDRWHGLAWMGPSAYFALDHGRAGVHNYVAGCE
jgi:hypothetical protein